MQSTIKDPLYKLDDLINRLNKRAEIRLQIPSRKSVQNNETDRLAELLKEAAVRLDELGLALVDAENELCILGCEREFYVLGKGKV